MTPRPSPSSRGCSPPRIERRGPSRWTGSTRTPSRCSGRRRGRHLPGREPALPRRERAHDPTSETMALPGFAPSATASWGRTWPPCRSARRSTCARRRQLLDGVGPGRRGSDDPEDLANRRDGCFPTLEDLRGIWAKRVPEDAGHGDAIELVPRNSVGHYWHHRIHPVQSARSRQWRPCAAVCCAVSVPNDRPEVRCLRRW